MNQEAEALRERLAELERANAELQAQVEATAQAQADVRDLEEALIAARVGLAEAEFERGVARMQARSETRSLHQELDVALARVQ